MAKLSLLLNSTNRPTFGSKKQLKKARMNISHFRFILFNLKIFGEIVTT